MKRFFVTLYLIVGSLTCLGQTVDFDDLINQGNSASENYDFVKLDSIADEFSFLKNERAELFESYFRGLSLLYEGNWDVSIDQLNRARKLAIGFADTCWITRAIHNISVDQYYLGDHQEALSSMKKILSYGGDCVNRPRVLLNVGSTYLMLSQYDEAISYLEEAEKIGLETYPYVLPFVYNQMGEWHAIQKDSIKAFEIRRKAFKYIDTVKWKGHIDVLMNATTNQTREAFDAYGADSGDLYFKKAFELGNRYNMNRGLSSLFSAKAKYLNAQGQYDSAKFYNVKSFIEADKVNDKILTASAMENLTTSLENKVLISNLKGEKAGLQRNIAIIGGLGLFALSTLLIVLTRQRLKHQKLLRIQEEERHGQQIQAVLSSHELQVMQALAEGQEHERKRLSQELHDTVGNMLATLKLQFESLSELLGLADGKGTTKVMNTAKLIDETCVEVRRISHNLSTGMISKMGLIGSIKQLVATINKTGKFDIEFNYDGEDLELVGDTEVHLYRVIQEIISNVIKHSQAGLVSIQITKHEKEVNVIVEDNGKGFDLELVKKEQRGMGLMNLESRVKQLGGQLVIDSKVGRGTTVIIDISL